MTASLTVWYPKVIANAVHTGITFYVRSLETKGNGFRCLMLNATLIN